MQNKKVISDKEILRKNEESSGKSALLLLRDVAIALVIIIVILQFVKPTIVFEHSMQDTLQPRDYVLLAKQAYRVHGPERGDIVVFSSNLPADSGSGTKDLIKRVIGLPGETVEVRDGSVFINGVPLNEDYTKDGTTEGTMAPLVIPDGEYFMMGDNRQVSDDSRDPKVGCIPENLILGKVFFRLFPISRAGRLYENLNPYSLDSAAGGVGSAEGSAAVMGGSSAGASGSSADASGSSVGVGGSSAGAGGAPGDSPAAS